MRENKTLKKFFPAYPKKPKKIAQNLGPNKNFFTEKILNNFKAPRKAPTSSPVLKILIQPGRSLPFRK
ncbi:MAG: hypothetical protein CM15mP77_4410 [Synechococcus sp.]|nr:MAG: hypothetical protein CM15mP77_4410 [Synechococcus sp.]